MAAERTIRSLLVKLGVKADDAALKRFDTAMGGVKRGMFALVAGSAAVVGALTAITVSTARAGDDAAKAAMRVGTTAEALQELEFAADRAGAPVGTVENALNRLNLSMQEAKDGVGEGGKTLNDFGIEVKELGGGMREPVTVLGDLADKMRELPDAASRATLANDVLGRGGRALVPLLMGGREELEKLRGEARLYGVISNDAAKQAEAFQDGMTNLKAIAGGLKITIGSALLPVMTDLLGSFRDWWILNGLLVRQRIERWAEDLARRIRELSRWVNETADRFGGMTKVLSTVLKVTLALAAGFVALKTGKFLIDLFNALRLLLPALGGAAGAAAIGKIALIAAAIAGLALVIEDLYVLYTGGESAIGEFIARHVEADGVLGALARRIEDEVDLLFELADGAKWAAEQLQSLLDVVNVRFDLDIDVTSLDKLVGLIIDADTWMRKLINPLQLVRAAFGMDEILERTVTWMDRILGRSETLVSLVSRLRGALGLSVESGTGPTVRSPEGMGAQLARGERAVRNEARGGRSSTNTWHISGVGLTEEGVQRLIEAERKRQSRNMEAVLAGGEV